MPELFQPEFLESLDRAEKDISADRIKKIKSLKDLIEVHCQDDLGRYANPNKVRLSYAKAVKKYPPIAFEN